MRHASSFGDFGVDLAHWALLLVLYGYKTGVPRPGLDFLRVQPQGAPVAEGKVGASQHQISHWLSPTPEQDEKACSLQPSRPGLELLICNPKKIRLPAKRSEQLESESLKRELQVEPPSSPLALDGFSSPASPPVPYIERLHKEAFCEWRLNSAGRRPEASLRAPVPCRGHRLAQRLHRAFSGRADGIQHGWVQAEGDLGYRGYGPGYRCPLLYTNPLVIIIIIITISIITIITISLIIIITIGAKTSHFSQSRRLGPRGPCGQRGAAKHCTKLSTHTVRAANWVA